MIYYVYSLSYEGYIFYIGISSQPVIRYSQHVCCTDYCTAGYISVIRMECILPEFNIIYIGDKTEAVLYELCLINYCIALNHLLCNCDLNPINNRLCIPFNFVNRPQYPRKQYSKKIRTYCNEKKKEYESNRYFNLDNTAITSK